MGAVGEVNGKSGNLNNILRKIYPRENGPAPANHLVAIFDCDQVCQCKFFLETLPLIHQADDVAMARLPSHSKAFCKCVHTELQRRKASLYLRLENVPAGAAEQIGSDSSIL